MADDGGQMADKVRVSSMEYRTRPMVAWGNAGMVNCCEAEAYQYIDTGGSFGWRVAALGGGIV